MKNLYQRLLAITDEVGKIEKTGMNSSQGYKFIEHAEVMATIRPQLVKHGVMVVPETLERNIDRYVKTTPGYKPTDPAKEQASYHVNVSSRYTIINADDPTDRIVCEWNGGEALDTSDKATNKALTASQKTFLMKLFNVSDKDDVDNHSPQVPTTPPKANTLAAPGLATPKQKVYMFDLIKQNYHINDKDLVIQMLKDNGYEADKMTSAQAGEFISALQLRNIKLTPEMLEAGNQAKKEAMEGE